MSSRHYTSVTIPESVREIGLCAFRGCTNLSSVVFSGLVASLQYGVFEGCSNLKTIYVPVNGADYFRKILPKELHGLIVEKQEIIDYIENNLQ